MQPKLEMPIMKKLLFLMLGACMVLAVSCAKEKNCRCSVPGSDKVHHLTIKDGDCAGLNTLEYNDEYTAFRRDSLYCIEK